MKQKRLLILAAGILQIPIIKKAHEMGIYVIATDGRPDAIGLPFADKAIIADITNKEKMLQIAKDEHIDGVIHPCSEVSMNVMGFINDQLHLSGISEQTAIRATNKHLMREAFEKGNAPSPKSILAESPEHAWQLFNETFTTNAILKPSRNSGSRGIAKITKGISKEDFLSLYDRALNESRDHSVLIEQFIEGPEFSVEIIVWNNTIHVLTVTDKKTTDAPYFVELGHNQPSCYPTNIVDKIKDAAIKGVQALKLNNCAAHAEIKVENGEAYIMEIGARLGGDFITTELTHLSTGIDMVAAAINVALGVEPCFDIQEVTHGVAIRYFCPTPGQVISITNTDVLKHPQVYDAELYIKPGDIVNEVKSSSDRSGHIIVTSDTPQGAILLAEELINMVEIKTKCK